MLRFPILHRALPLLAFAGIPPAEIPSYPLTQQVAEKLHAYTRPRATGEGSRVKDMLNNRWPLLASLHLLGPKGTMGYGSYDLSGRQMRR